MSVNGDRSFVDNNRNKSINNDSVSNNNRNKKRDIIHITYT